MLCAHLFVDLLGGLTKDLEIPNDSVLNQTACKELIAPFASVYSRMAYRASRVCPRAVMPGHA